MKNLFRGFWIQVLAVLFQLWKLGQDAGLGCSASHGTVLLHNSIARDPGHIWQSVRQIMGGAPLLRILYIRDY